ncbi:MAG TPA: sugar kinase [Candidatus Kapabacteria bacterium]|nr:sugar kinase [Candidatus Kapabacteria bacterium]
MADSQSPHLVSLGECLAELCRRTDGAFAAGYAGDAFNALFYASRLGLRTRFISALGNDLFTPMIAEGIEREGICTRWLARLADRRNGIYFIETDAEGEYTFHFWRTGSAATRTLRIFRPESLLEAVAGARFFLVTGIAVAVMEDRERLIDLLRAARGCTTIVFDTNYRPALWHGPEEYREWLDRILPEVDLLLAGAGDLRAAFGGEQPEALCTRLTEAGPQRIVLKDGARGAGLISSGGTEWFPAPRTAVVDTTGAGDAFNAGFLSAAAAGLPDADCVALGLRVAARVLGVRGAIDPAFGITWEHPPFD